MYLLSAISDRRSLTKLVLTVVYSVANEVIDRVVQKARAIAHVNLLKMALAQCRDRDGWEWTSRLRDFDLSLCAEEGVILTSLLAILVVAALARVARLSYLPARVLSRSGRWRLWAKLVRFVVPVPCAC